MSSPYENPLQTLLNEWGVKSNLVITSNQVTVDSVTVVNDNGRNTKLSLTFKNSGVQRNLFFYRLDVDQYCQLTDTSFDDLEETTVRMLVPRIAARAGRFLDPEEFLDTPINRVEGESSISVDLTPRADSIIFNGSLSISLLLAAIAQGALLTVEGAPITTVEGASIVLAN